MRDFHSIPWDFHTRSSFCNSTRLSPVRSGHTWSFVFPADVSIFILDIVLSLLLLFFFFFWCYWFCPLFSVAPKNCTVSCSAGLGGVAGATGQRVKGQGSGRMPRVVEGTTTTALKFE